jgi:hypothetical protein
VAGRVWAAQAWSTRSRSCAAASYFDVSMTVQKRPNRMSPWRARFHAPDGRERSRSFARRIDAGRWLRDQQTAVDLGAWADLWRGGIRFGDWTEQVMVTRPDLRPSTIARDDIVTRKLVFPSFCSRTLGSNRASDLRSWLTDISTLGTSRTVSSWQSHGQSQTSGPPSGLDPVKAPKRIVQRPPNGGSDEYQPCTYPGD